MCNPQCPSCLGQQQHPWPTQFTSVLQQTAAPQLMSYLEALAAQQQLARQRQTKEVPYNKHFEVKS